MVTLKLFDIDGMLIFAASLEEAVKFANLKNKTNEISEN